MIKTVEATGKTTEEAVAAARRQAGLTEDEGSVDVMCLPKSGFLGLGATQAKVRISFEVPDPKPAAQERPRPAPTATFIQPPAAVVYPAGSCEEQTRRFLRGLLERMDISAEMVITPREGGGLNVELVGPNMGAVIGRRGETLDAIQHLTNYAVNRDGEKRMHISVDAESYRSKREETLARLAEKMAAKALKYKRSMALEPMNSYERHVIHTALQDYEGVSTSSVGTEPNRRVVVSCGKTQDRPSPRPAAKPAPRPAPRPEVSAPKTRATAEIKSSDIPQGVAPPSANKSAGREWK